MSSASTPLATLLATARSRKGLSLRQVEAATGISNAYLSQLEGGRRVREPSPVLLHKLGELYGLAYAELLSAAGYPLPGPATERPDSTHSIAARLGPTTEEEEEALLDYLHFLRSRGTRKGR